MYFCGWVCHAASNSTLIRNESGIYVLVSLAPSSQTVESLLIIPRPAWENSAKIKFIEFTSMEKYTQLTTLKTNATVQVHVSA